MPGSSSSSGSSTSSPPREGDMKSIAGRTPPAPAGRRRTAARRPTAPGPATAMKSTCAPSRERAHDRGALGADRHAERAVLDVAPGHDLAARSRRAAPTVNCEYGAYARSRAASARACRRRSSSLAGRMRSVQKAHGYRAGSGRRRRRRPACRRRAARPPAAAGPGRTGRAASAALGAAARRFFGFAFLAFGFAGGLATRATGGSGATAITTSGTGTRGTAADRRGSRAAPAGPASPATAPRHDSRQHRDGDDAAGTARRDRRTFATISGAHAVGDHAANAATRSPPSARPKTGARTTRTPSRTARSPRRSSETATPQPASAAPSAAACERAASPTGGRSGLPGRRRHDGTCRSPHRASAHLGPQPASSAARPRRGAAGLGHRAHEHAAARGDPGHRAPGRSSRMSRRITGTSSASPRRRDRTRADRHGSGTLRPRSGTRSASRARPTTRAVDHLGHRVDARLDAASGPPAAPSRRPASAMSTRARRSAVMNSDRRPARERDRGVAARQAAAAAACRGPTQALTAITAIDHEHERDHREVQRRLAHLRARGRRSGREPVDEHHVARPPGRTRAMTSTAPAATSLATLASGSKLRRRDVDGRLDARC